MSVLGGNIALGSIATAFTVQRRLGETNGARYETTLAIETRSFTRGTKTRHDTMDTMGINQNFDRDQDI